LGLFAFFGHDAHRRALCCFTNDLSVGSIIRLPLDEGFQVNRRDLPNVMAHFADFAAPKVRAATGLHRHNARLQLTEEGQHLITTQLL
jgi:hypothetical protein